VSEGDEMACIGLGIDIVSVERFSRLMERRGTRLIERLFTPAERRYCSGRHLNAEAYSARFAAKEAFLKALGSGLRGGLGWKEIEVSNDDLGRPLLNVTGRAREFADSKGARTFNLSLSHAAGCAVAVVLLEDA
jgi:holo-[acyl-carrier protein] synthase